MTDAETGRRRCRIPEHRTQIRALQRQVAWLQERQSRMCAEARDRNRQIAELLNQVSTMRRWRFLWLCRWFGHREWYWNGGKFRRRPGICGRCGTSLTYLLKPLVTSEAELEQTWRPPQP